METNMDKIGRYEIKKKLQKGGMGTVFLAFDPLIKRQVAAKLLPNDLLEQDSFRERFQQEAEVVANLEHAHIVPVYDYGVQENQPYIIMRYMRGGSLDDRLKEGQLTLSEASRIVKRLAVALDFVHERDIVHRDIKPANILFDESSQAYLSDFGIAKILADDARQLTGDKIVGTPDYMSPEQVRAQQHIDGRSDIYSLGVVIFQMLTGQMPYKAGTAMGTALAHVIDPIPDIVALRGNLPKECVELINRSMAKSPVDRFQTAGEMAEWLSLIASGKRYLLRLLDL